MAKKKTTQNKQLNVRIHGDVIKLAKKYAKQCKVRLGLIVEQALSKTLEESGTK